MATTRSNSREERRRKIVERGSDRLALITGRTQNLPSDHHHHHHPIHDLLNQSYPPTFSFDHHDNDPHTLFSHQNNAGSESSADASGTMLLKNETNAEVSRANRFDEIRNQVQPELHRYGNNKEAMQAPVVDDRTKSEPLLATSPVQKPSNDTGPLQEASRNQFDIFSCKQVNSCIIASQGIRSFCALMIALLVVLSYIDFPLFGRTIVSSEAIVASRPLYILLLTDLTIVLAQLYLEERRHSEETEKEREISQEDGHNFTQALKVMERSLVVYQTIQAVFTDFSIYTVVVVCGLSLV